MITERYIVREVIEPEAQEIAPPHATYDYEKHPMWPWAVNTFNVLRPLIAKRRLTNDVRRFYCTELEIGKTALYGYLNTLRDSPFPSALLPKPKGPKKGSSRTLASKEKIMAKVIEEQFLTRQKRSVAACYKIVIAECHEAGIEDVPSRSTFGRRVKRISNKVRWQKRKGRSFMLNENAPATTHFTAERPMQRVQIDHTTAVVSLVDSQLRETIGRPIISFAIDHYTRICTGFTCYNAGPSFLTSFERIIHTGGRIDRQFFIINKVLEHSFDGIKVGRGAGILLLNLNPVIQILTYISRLDIPYIFNTVTKAEIQKIGCRKIISLLSVL